MKYLRHLSTESRFFSSYIPYPLQSFYCVNCYNRCLIYRLVAIAMYYVGAFGINPKVVVRVPLRWRPFLSQKLRHFHENIRSCVENECCFPRTVNISNINFTSKYLYHQIQYSKPWDSKCLALITQMVIAFGMNPMLGDSSPPSGRDIFCLNKPWHFHKNNRSCVEVNADARA